MPVNSKTVPVEVADLNVTLGQNPILYNVNAKIKSGEFVALLGGNGAGKTTLLRAILGLITPKSGTIKLFGTPRNRFNQWHRIGYVPQRGMLQLDNATVREVVTSGRLSRRKPFLPLSQSDRSAITKAIETVRLANRSNSQLRLLSGGQQQRALIARGLATEPDLLILDEPLAGLDLPTQQVLADLFAKLKNQGITILVVLHELGTLESLIDRSIVLQSGRVIYSGPLTELSGPAGNHHHCPTEFFTTSFSTAGPMDQ